MSDGDNLTWNLADVWETVAGQLPEAPAQIHGERSFTWAEFDARANGIASALATEATADDRVALYLRNCPEYLEATHAALKLGIPSVNTNYRYGGEELLYLWNDADITSVVFHGSFTEAADRLRPQAGKIRQWLHVDDGTAPCPEWAVPYEQAAAQGTSQAVRSSWGRHGSDLFLLYTGGTTGLPKGVMWRSIDFLRQTNEVGSLKYPLEQGVDGIRAMLTVPGRTHISASPLMHGNGLFGALITMHQGGLNVSLTAPGFDAAEFLDTIDRHRVTSVAIAGEVFGKRILRAFDAAPGRWNIQGVKDVLNSAALLSEPTKRGLLEHWPEATIMDGFSSSEGFGLGWSLATKDNIPATGRFNPGANVRVFDDDDALVAAGSGVIGRLAVSGRVPLGYYKDKAKSDATFVEIGGERYSMPGDRGIVNDDGTIQLIGRESLCINSGGEKIFTEEVEAVIVDLTGVSDALVVGLPDAEWGQIVTAVVSLEPGAERSESEIIDGVKARLAGYKAPRRVRIVDDVPRGPNGKADYDRARQLAAGTE
ncbi:AMP-binding protein [Nakamurella lactea]|uniref:AMP-binding protein n=1 Tax=Nakamurella lactea TaxID=459515 RepID=UPI00048F62E9|nr:AMP-binding protein [Nakamurella lactea]